MHKTLSLLDLGQASTYEDIKVKASDEQLEMIARQYKQGKLEDYKLDDIKNINEDKLIAVFVENRCTDAATMVPFINHLAELNEHIKPKFYEASKYECVVKRVAGEFKIPTVVFIKNDKKTVSGVYKEFPIKVRALIEENPDNKEFIVKEEFRKGKYNIEIQKDIIDLILAQ